MRGRDVERALVSRETSSAYGAERDARGGARGADDDEDDGAGRRARRTWRRTRGVGVMILAVCACACASAIGGVGGDEGEG